MARSRDTRFYEIPLPDEIPKSQKWLISYHENCRRLVGYILDSRKRDDENLVTDF